MKKEQMSMLEIAEELMKEKKKPQKFIDLAKEVATSKGLVFEESADKIGQFYTDLTMSSKFVYCGEETFDLKERKETSLYEKEFFEEGQTEVEELQRQLEAMPKKVVEIKQERPTYERPEYFMPQFDDEDEREEEDEDEDKLYIDDVVSGDSDYEEEFEEFEEDEYEDMYDEE